MLAKLWQLPPVEVPQQRVEMLWLMVLALWDGLYRHSWCLVQM
jgi:hypothetical protein